MRAEIVRLLLWQYDKIERFLPGFPFVWLEVIFWLIAIGLTFLTFRNAYRPRPDWMRRVDAFARIPNVPFYVGVFTFFLRATLLLIYPVPSSGVYDEFSYILGGQTFARGMLTNGYHPLAPFFETFHINVWPTYQSMYMPAQAAFLAIGIKLFGDPWWGVLLTVSLMAGAITWMLRACVPPRWALLGGLYIALRYGTFSFFVNSFFGGAVAATGGALLLGSWFRLRKQPDNKNAALFAVGLLMLGFSRPYEGAIFSLPVALLCLWWLAKRIQLKETIRFATPAIAILFAGLAFLLYYNYRGTGHATVMPYAVNQKLYHVTDPFIWQRSIHVPNYHHTLMARNYIYNEVPIYHALESFSGICALLYERFTTYYLAVLWPMLLILPAGFAIVWRDRRTRIAAISFLAVCFGVLLEAWQAQPQYVAPMIGAVVLMVIQGLRWLRTRRWRGRWYGRRLSTVAIALLAFWIVLQTGEATLGKYEVPFEDRPQDREQERVRAILLRTPGDHLVIVHDRDTAYIHRDWIHNAADIDGQRIVWARDMGPYMDLYLLKYYSGRHIWWLDNDDGVNALRPYEMRDLPDYIARQVTHYDHRP